MYFILLFDGKVGIPASCRGSERASRGLGVASGAGFRVFRVRPAVPRLHKDPLPTPPVLSLPRA
jgi:hypothetical protein